MLSIVTVQVPVWTSVKFLKLLLVADVWSLTLTLASGVENSSSVAGTARFLCELHFAVPRLY